jgi:hypothetical protein
MVCWASVVNINIPNSLVYRGQHRSNNHYVITVFALRPLALINKKDELLVLYGDTENPDNLLVTTIEEAWETGTGDKPSLSSTHTILDPTIENRQKWLEAALSFYGVVLSKKPSVQSTPATRTPSARNKKKPKLFEAGEGGATGSRVRSSSASSPALVDGDDSQGTESDDNTKARKRKAAKGAKKRSSKKKPKLPKKKPLSPPSSPPPPASPPPLPSQWPLPPPPPPSQRTDEDDKKERRYSVHDLTELAKILRPEPTPVAPVAQGLNTPMNGVTLAAMMEFFTNMKK